MSIFLSSSSYRKTHQPSKNKIYIPSSYQEEEGPRYGQGQGWRRRQEEEVNEETGVGRRHSAVVILFPSNSCIIYFEIGDRLQS